MCVCVCAFLIADLELGDYGEIGAVSGRGEVGVEEEEGGGGGEGATI